MINARILVVEDEHVVALDLAQRLRALGYGVQGVVASGPDAIRSALDTRPDIILMDIHLHGEMDGIEAAAQIITQYDVPIIYL